MFVAKELTNHWADMFLLYIDTSYRLRDGFKLFYFLCKILWMALSFFRISLNVESSDARGAAASFIKSMIKVIISTSGIGDLIQVKKLRLET